MSLSNPALSLPKGMNRRTVGIVPFDKLRASGGKDPSVAYTNVNLRLLPEKNTNNMNKMTEHPELPDFLKTGAPSRPGGKKRYLLAAPSSSRSPPISCSPAATARRRASI